MYMKCRSLVLAHAHLPPRAPWRSSGGQTAVRCRSARHTMMRARSAEESAALERLRERLLSSGEVSSSAGRQMLASFGGVDLCLLRFLRARKLDAAKAHAALTTTLAFRNENGVGAPQTAAAVRSEGVSDWWCGTFAGTTSTGCPVTYWRFRCIEADQLKQRFDDAQLNRFYAAWMERGLALQREVAAERPEGCPGNVDIYDLQGVGWRQLSSGARLLSGVLAVAQEHYPENLKQAVVVNAPATFTGAWRLISAVIDKGTQQKFLICKDGAKNAIFAPFLDFKHPIILSRQARDKHRESHKTTVLPQARRTP
jgi:hypothetical protein